MQTVINLDAEETGLEAELNSRPVDGLTLQLGRFVPRLDGQGRAAARRRHDRRSRPAAGAGISPATRWRATNSRLAGGTLGLQADVQYSSDFCFTVLCAPVEHEDSYTVGNARISYDSNSAWSVAAFVNNVTEEEYRVYAFDSSLFSGVVGGRVRQAAHVRRVGHLSVRRLRELRALTGPATGLSRRRVRDSPAGPPMTHRDKSVTQIDQPAREAGDHTGRLVSSGADPAMSSTDEQQAASGRRALRHGRDAKRAARAARAGRVDPLHHALDSVLRSAVAKKASR